MNFSKIPEELKKDGLFCFWKREQVGGRQTKVPYRLDGMKARSTERDDFVCFDIAERFAGRFDGIGLGIFDGWCAVDIDHCYKDGKLSDMARDIINTMLSYTEISPSGEGIRIIFRAEKLRFDKEKYYINNRDLGLEVYVSGATNKYVTLTGNALIESPVQERSEQISAVLEKYMRRKTAKAAPKAPKSAPARAEFSDGELLEKISRSKQGAKFLSLWKGEIPAGKSHSEADLSLCSILAFWCGGDVAQMDRLFRQSGLYREKWEREDYRTQVLNLAASSSSAFYSGGEYARSSAAEDLGPETELEKVLKYSFSDIGSGKLFADKVRDVARYSPERKSWFCFDEGIWQIDPLGLKAMEHCKRLADRLYALATEISDEEKRSAYIKHYAKWQKRSVRETILKDAQSVYPLYVRELDSDPFVFNCANGTLHLDSMEFTEHRASDMLTKKSPAVFDPEARCERFDRFVSEIMQGDPEKMKFLQKAMGYGLSGDTRYECLFFLYGATTRNGKGTLCESVLRVLGDYGITARPETISLKLNNSSNAPSEDIARLAGVRFVNISEPGKGLVLNAAQIKSMTGNDTINARFLHENSFDFKPQFKLYINTNYLPVVTDLTLFSSGRVVCVPFDRHFSEQEQDKSLKSEFAKPENMSAILNWLIAGAKLLKDEGLYIPEAVERSTENYRMQSDKTAQFVEECLERCEGEAERTADIYARYKRWCGENGYKCENAKNLNQALAAYGTITRKKVKDKDKTTVFLGYRLVEKCDDCT